MPSAAFVPFYDGRFDPLLEKEKRLLRLFKGTRPPFYVIGITKTASHRELAHEIAHALFFTSAPYRKAVRMVLGTCGASMLKRKLVGSGYAKRVVEDEVHAYLVASSGTLGPHAHALAPLRKALRALYRQHAAALALPWR